jgi:proline dehydrogenase
VAAAKEADSKVEIDMESTAYTAKTLEAVKALHRQHGNVRAVIQAYLHRSEKDIEDLNRLGISVRLCKGAYLESSEVAFADKAEVDANCRRLMQRLLSDGAYPALATHDETIVGDVVKMAGERQIAPDRFEFQMLYGIRRDLQQDLVRRGFRVRVYVPYGGAWYPYFMRRLAERPANVWFVLKSFGRG